MIDIHSHILPSTDDGSKTINETKEIIEIYNEIGFTKVIPSPHFYPGLFEKDNNEIEETFYNLNKLFSNNLLSDFTREYYVDFVFLNNLSVKDFVKPYPNGKHILIEFSFTIPPINWQTIIFEIQNQGYIPILAHPERYLWIKETVNFIMEFKNRGGLLQGNLGSFENMYGKYSRKNAIKLMQENLFDFLATDTHSFEQLKILGRKTLPKIKKKFGDSTINQLMKENPKQLLG